MAAVKKALIVGVNRYSMPGNDLRGCVNDALTMAKLLTEHYQFGREDIRLLVDDRATTANMRQRLEWLIDGAGAGSSLVFHFSGHGSQVRDRDSDELEDGLDEILCPHDLDWDDPFTDDELRTAIGNVPEGVNLTMVLDCCHSGTGTRDFFKEPELRGAKTRFLVPPPDIGYRAAGGVTVTAEPERSVNMVGRRSGLALRHFGSALTAQNAVLIAGCRSDQTSADAWIENDYRGALTYSLYRTAKLRGYQLSYEDLVREAGDWLESSGYAQVPQLECPEERKRWSFLGQSEHRPAFVSMASSSPLSSMDRPELALAPPTRVVFIHGIGHHEPGYSNQWRAAFNRYLALPLGQFHEVVWDDVFDERTRPRDLAAPPALTRDEQGEAERLKAELREVLQIRSDLLTDIACGNGSRDGGLPNGIVDRAAARGFLDWFMNFDEYIGDFVKYLVSSDVRKAVKARLELALAPILASGHPTVLVSHSWGTVVAYDVLSTLPRGRLAHHFTLGSPLWMGPVRRKLGFDGQRRAAGAWINIDAKGDLIGGKLHGSYKVNHDYSVPSCGGSPHGSYFHPENALVQRDIIARAIQEAARTLADIVPDMFPTNGHANGSAHKRKRSRKAAR
jgi:hypothetical protein